MKFDAAKVVPVVSAGFLVGLLVFGYGIAVGKYQVWPWASLEQVKDVFDSYRRYGRLVPAANLFSRAPADAPREAFHVHQADAVMPGYYVFVGWDDSSDGFAAWLYDSSGELQHRWFWDYEQLDLDENGPTNGSTMPHAFKVMPDGSALVSFDKGDVMARIDACGKPVWRLPGIYHHSMEFTDDGSVWTWRGGGNATWGPYNYLVEFDPENGEILREIGLIEDMIQPDPDLARLFSVRADHPFVSGDGDNEAMNPYDFFHPNDLEELPAAIADQFELFSAGDLMMSFRNLDLVIVMGPDAKAVKWYGTSPWRRQHDPDFRPDGKISIFSNNGPVGRSEIYVVDPSTGEVTNELEAGNLRFFSTAMGKHQYLPNGNVLITVPAEGRIIEVDSGGDKVLEFNNLVAGMASQNAHVENGLWFPVDYFSTQPSCTTGRD